MRTGWYHNLFVVLREGIERDDSYQIALSMLQLRLCVTRALHCRIFALMGPPDPQTWPEVESLQHWRANTENVRMRVPRTAGGRTALPHHIQAASYVVPLCFSSVWPAFACSTQNLCSIWPLQPTLDSVLAFP